MSELAPETPEVEVTPEVTEDPAVTDLKRRNAGLQRKVQELLAAQASGEGNPKAQEETMPEEVTSQVQQTLDYQQQVINSLLMERWQAKAVAAHPEATAFADLLVGDSEESVMGIAQDIATRIKGGQPAAEAAAEATTEEAEPVSETPTPVPVPAGSPGVEGLQGPTDSEELTQLRQAVKRNPGSQAAWSQFLNKKFELANAGNPLARYEATQDQGGVGLT